MFKLILWQYFDTAADSLTIDTGRSDTRLIGEQYNEYVSKYGEMSAKCILRLAITDMNDTAPEQASTATQMKSEHSMNELLGFFSGQQNIDIVKILSCLTGFIMALAALIITMTKIIRACRHGQNFYLQIRDPVNLA